ncbi:adenylate/guanylate cyclase domain-containing protein [Phenylobacterium sp.]|uniref:adenylate/guanylate cyclase domain-containing protein n=1 Tax=Phenylobacterium sp. TaxID=1871053 RepID=UPI0025CF9689|nr:adenylate/guanylate cyclase domain-containing protein [Phenylobacterium sp.]MBX3485276.1 GAF domain-containing protein [Phenylobacterium sp.]MCW5760118.1 GAF domain-containing protein [Phenylobacterium sp.]
MASGGLQGAVKGRSAPGQRGRKLGLAMVVLAVLSLICGPFFVDALDRSAPEVRDGAVSYAAYGPLTAPVALKGEWRATWLSAPGGTPVDFRIASPGEWKGVETPAGPVPMGAAVSYRLHVGGLEPGRYTLFVPKIYAGQRVYADGRLLSRSGTFGLTPETTRYLGRVQEVVIDVAGRDLDLRLDMAAFHHRENGMPEPPVFGLSEPMSYWILLDWIRSLLLIGSLLLLACLASVIFVFRPDDRVAMYLALGSMSLLPLAATLSHDNLLAIAMPGVPFGAMISLQILATTAALSAALAYANELFPRESPRWPYRILQGLNGARFLVFAGLAVTGHVILLSEASAAVYLFRIVTLVYILGVVIWATVRRRDGAVLFLIGLGAMLASIIYSDLTINAGVPRLLSLNLLPAGMLMLLFTQLVLLAERWSLAIGSEARTNDDLRRLLDVNIAITSEMRLEALLAKMVQVASTVTQADRSSLFLFDEKAGELWSVVAEGLEERPIRFPCDQGLAGWVFTHGELVNLSDAYADPRFNKAIDEDTGYHTTSLLTVPVITRDGRRLGVMQAMNSQEHPGFDAADEARMAAFAAQAAVAIDNARLFADVAAERNYNESILRSMSTGVVTLDRDVRSAKLNPAAADILEIGPDRLEGADVRAWLQASNPRILAEIDAVAASGRPRSLLDADVRTASGETISANLSIVPLVGELGGLVILVEDISEEKRMESAMRRFMSQKVVDQILEHDGDDLLFGVSCRASVLFADIRNFTALAERLQPRETVDMLNEVFADLVEAVSASDGVLDKFLGDAVMAVYGAPLPAPRDPQNAVESAVNMMAMVAALNERRRDRGREELRLGVGIATGDVVAGTIGSLKRMDYTVIGDSVNLAARLQQLTKVYQVGVIICEHTAAALDGTMPLRELDTLRVRGRRRSEKVFQVLTGDPAARSPALADYGRGRELLAGRRWKEAVAAFEAAVAADPDDRPSILLLERARALARRPPPSDWDGVWGLADADAA